jgi:integrase
MASIRPRPRADGSTSYAVLWRTADGRQTSLTFALLPLAEAAQRLIEDTGADADRVAQLLTSPASSTLSVSDALRIHVSELTGILDQTRAVYLRLAAQHIDPTLGALPIAAIDKTAVATWVNRLDQTGMADKTIRNLHGLLSATVHTAVDKGWLTGKNPCRGMRLPRRDHGDEAPTFLTHDEWQVLLSELKPYWQPLFTFLAGTGVRWGEAAGLTVGHVDLRAKVPAVRINQAARQTPNGQQIGPTKTPRSKRMVSLPAVVVDVLEPLLDGRLPEDRLFVSARGNPIHAGLYGRQWQPAVRRAQDRERHGERALTRAPRIHDLRHSHASWLIAAGVDLLAVSRRLGHKSIATTVDLYGHFLPHQQRTAAEAAGRAFEPPPEE